MTPDYRVSTFVGPGATGTPHSVYIRESFEQTAAFKALSRSCADTLVLLATGSSGNQPGFSKVRFLAHGHEIVRCGSGTLAAAWALSEIAELGSGSVPITTGVETVQVRKCKGLFGYSSWPLRQYRLRRRLFWERLVGLPIIDGALCGDTGHYVIIELASEQAVIQATPNLAKLIRYSRRALILTAHTSTGYALRYFAPQYGQPEGAATGSANIQLLRYWYRRSPRLAMTARQCSVSGGAFQGVPGPGAVRLYGKVQPIYS